MDFYQKPVGTVAAFLEGLFVLLVLVLVGSHISPLFEQYDLV